MIRIDLQEHSRQDCRYSSWHQRLSPAYWLLVWSSTYCFYHFVFVIPECSCNIDVSGCPFITITYIIAWLDQFAFLIITTVPRWELDGRRPMGSIDYDEPRGSTLKRSRRSSVSVAFSSTQEYLPTLQTHFPSQQLSSWAYLYHSASRRTCSRARNTLYQHQLSSHAKHVSLHHVFLTQCTPPHFPLIASLIPKRKRGSPSGFYLCRLRFIESNVLVGTHISHRGIRETNPS